MAKRLARARQKIALARIPYRVPGDAELPGRLATASPASHAISAPPASPTLRAAGAVLAGGPAGRPAATAGTGPQRATLLPRAPSPGEFSRRLARLVTGGTERAEAALRGLWPGAVWRATMGWCLRRVRDDTGGPAVRGDDDRRLVPPDRGAGQGAAGARADRGRDRGPGRQLPAALGGADRPQAHRSAARGAGAHRAPDRRAARAAGPHR